MDKEAVLQKIKDRGVKNKRYLHSPDHVLADELCRKLSDPKHFAVYLKLCMKEDHARVRLLLGQVMESKTAKSPARLFMYLIKVKDSKKELG